MGVNCENYPHLWQAFLTSLFLVVYYFVARVVQAVISRKLVVQKEELKVPTNLPSRPQRNPLVTSAIETVPETKSEDSKRTTGRPIPPTEDKKEVVEEKATFRPRRPVLTSNTPVASAASTSSSTTRPKLAVFNTSG